MSSHHVVRDDQEPALLLLQKFEGIDKIMPQLLEWSPVVVTTRLLSNHFVHHNIKLDVVLMRDRDEPLATTGQFQNIEECRTLPDQSLLTSGLNYLSRRNMKSVNVLSEWTPEQAEVCEQFDMDVVFYFNAFKYALIRNNTFKKWSNSGAVFTIPRGEIINHSGGVKEGTKYINPAAGIVSFIGEAPFWVEEMIY